ncbi:MAG TPA: hypothetical protein VHD62_02365 [Opitutaceae bacterium]|nr:hypothetical protein [Opitutaceae bacterium]
MHPQHKLIITGTGRAGTTFLVRLLTELDQPTGYDRENWRRDYFAHCAAGLEHDLADPASPYIVKNPELCVTLPAILESGRVVIDHAIIPVRDLDAAAASRVRVSGTAANIPGGLLGTHSPAEQKNVLAGRFHRLVETLLQHDIPHTFLLFPRFVRDADYAFAKLGPLLRGVDRASFDDAFRRIADPEMVHTFGSPASPPVAGHATFASAQHRKRIRRRVRRALAWTTLAASLTLAFVSHTRSVTPPLHADTLAPAPARAAQETENAIAESFFLSALPADESKAFLSHAEVFEVPPFFGDAAMH